MLESLVAEGFRKYQKIALKGLGRINCITGSNNIGKTSILEAVYIWSCGKDVDPVIEKILSSRVSDIALLFHDRTARPMTMAFDGTSGGRNICFTHKFFLRPCSSGWEVTCNTEYDAASFCNAKYVDSLSYASGCAEIYSSLRKKKLAEELARMVSAVFPEAAGIDSDGETVSITRRDGAVLPLNAFGDGVQRWFCIAGSILLGRNSVLCIDEADTGFHHSSYYGFSENLIRSAVSSNVQVFMTTHNIEFIDALLEAAETFSGDISQSVKIITAREREEAPAFRVLNASEAMEARGKFALELR